MGSSSFFSGSTGYTQIDPAEVEAFKDEAEAAATAAAASAASSATSASTAAASVQAAAGTATPLVDGTAAVGAGVKWAREDHVHPTDTSRADAAATTAALALKAATTYVDAQDATLTAAIALKAATTYVDAQDAAKAPLASPALTGTPTAPTATVGTNTTQLATTAFVLENAAGSGVSTLNGQTGSLTLGLPPLGRLTLTSGVPVMTTSQAGATTVRYTPYVGEMVPIYNGSNMVPTVFSELSQATTDTTKSPAAAAASKNYDMFVWDDSGTIRCTRGPVWTSDTARGTGAGTSELHLQNGVLLNKNSITNGPAALRGTYVGTIRTNASSTVDFIFGSIGAGGVAAVFNVWNAYNRVSVSTIVRDSTDSWSYGTAATWRAADNSATMRVSMVRGLDEDAVQAIYAGLAVAGTNPTLAVAGVGLDSTTAFSGTTGSNGNASSSQAVVGMYTGCPGLGSHYLSAIELNSGTNASTWYGDLGLAYLQSGFHASLRA